MVEALKAAGARVYATDIKADGYPLDQQLDSFRTVVPNIQDHSMSLLLIPRTATAAS
jgi:hypothetical protein